MKRVSFIAKDFARRDSINSWKPVHTPRRDLRIRFLCLFCLIWAVAVSVRMYNLQVVDGGKWEDWALRQHFVETGLAPQRGPIQDREGRLMAVSVPAGSVYARPRQVIDKEEAATKLSGLLGIGREAILQRLNSNSPFVWIARQIPRVEAQRVADLELPGVSYLRESRRFYPYNNAASALLGRVGIDGNGLSGVEAMFERRLHGEKVQTVLNRDAFGKFIDVSYSGQGGFDLPRGDSLTLTLDAGIQLIMDRELEQGMRESRASRAMALMINAKTGEILAMSQTPNLNFNNAVVASKDALKNQVAEAVFEPGSVLKPFVTAVALDKKLIKENELLDCENGVFTFGGHRIRDVKPNKILSVRDVLIRSSNIGMVKIGQRMGKQGVHEALSSFGLGRDSGLNLPGESRGILRNPAGWADVDIATHSFGQGVAVTPLQMVRSISALANGGYLPELKLVINDGRVDNPGTRIVSADTAQKMRSMLIDSVEADYATGKRAAISGIRVGGKTGTAQKAKTNGRGYQKGAYIASFLGFADGSSAGIPQVLSLVVIVDEPRGASIYGGVVAAPIFKSIMEKTFMYLSSREQPKQTPTMPLLVDQKPANGKEDLKEIEVETDIATQLAYAR